MRFGTSDHIFNIHDVQLIIIFISLTKIKGIVENLDELCFQCTVCYRQSRGRQCATDSQEADSVLQTVKRQTVCYRQSRGRQCVIDSQEADSVLQTVKRQTVCYRLLCVVNDVLQSCC
jgi:hypothetical protein